MNEAENDTPGLVRLSEGLGPAPKRTGFDKYAFLADFDITRSTCGSRAGKYASEVTQRAYMVWADQQRENERLRAALQALVNALNSGHSLTIFDALTGAEAALGPNAEVNRNER